MTSIDERPVEVYLQLVPGHWEGDLSKGAYNRSQIGTLAERTTLCAVLARVDSATALGTANAFSTVLNKVDAQMRLSMAYDQGREMAAYIKSKVCSPVSNDGVAATPVIEPSVFITI